MARDSFKEKQDRLGEKAVHLFLNDYFYPTVSNYVECFDKENQFNGIDTRFRFNGLDYLCDEKAALDYTNMQKGYLLKTFCLELSFLNRKDDEMEGWFTSDDKKNNSYMFVWVDKSTNNVITSPDEIEEAEIMLVWKEDIYNYLNNIGWNRENIRTKSRLIRENNDKNMGDYKINGCKFSYAQYLPEKPINLLIRREEYASMPHTIRRKFRKTK